MTITVQVETAVALRRFASYPPRIKDSVRRQLERFGVDLQRHIKADKLSGQVLRNRSGTLRRSINSQVFDIGHGLVLIVGTNVKYAAFHEFGFHGVENVRSHTRRTLKGGTAVVREHIRNVNYPAHSFLRSSLDDMRGALTRDYLDRAVKDVK